MEVSRTGTAPNAQDAGLRGGHSPRFGNMYEAPTTGQGPRSGRGADTSGTSGRATDVLASYLVDARRGIKTNAVGNRADLQEYLRSSIPTATNTGRQGNSLGLANLTLESSRISHHNPLNPLNLKDCNSVVEDSGRHDPNASLMMEAEK